MIMATLHQLATLSGRESLLESTAVSMLSSPLLSMPGASAGAEGA